MLRKGHDSVDVVTLLLASPCHELGEYARKGLLSMLYALVNTSEGMPKFNQPKLVDGLSLTRLSRLRVLLEEVNEELPEGERVLEMVGYFSVLFEKIVAGWKIRYTIILDKSGSMDTCDHHVSRWKDAGIACEHMAEAMEDLAVGGMTMYLFSSPTSQHPKYENLKCSEDVQKIFGSQCPGGSTDLAGAMHQAFGDHFQHGQPEHILVITDGEPDNSASLVRELIAGINNLANPDELGITFMQVGHCHSAAAFLHELQDCLTEQGAKWNVIDCITHNSYHGQKLCDIVHRYLPDKHGH